ncbi:MAG TPA: TetR/AcrR family transcriptional regulator [Planctomycetota bacterium]|nr:TetR/AcrR family transcriptional regulator [Planctomycetota bacterium]
MSSKREKSAEATKARVLQAAQSMFARQGIDTVTIAGIARKARVSVPTVYALFKSKAGILRGLIQSTLFGPRYREAQQRLEGETDSARLIELTAGVARSIYESESTELGLLQGASAFSPELRKQQRELEAMRLDMQEERVKLLFTQSKSKRALTFETARQILWMYTSRDVYRMLVHESGWTPDQYQEWLAATLVAALVEPARGAR